MHVCSSRWNPMPDHSISADSCQQKWSGPTNMGWQHYRENFLWKNIFSPMGFNGQTGDQTTLVLYCVYNSWVFFSKLQLSNKIWQIGLICLIFLPIIVKLKKTKSMDPKWSPILKLTLVLSCLTSVIWLFTLSSFTFVSCLYYPNASHYKDGWAVNFNFFIKGIIFFIKG